MKSFAMTCTGVCLLLFASGFQAQAGRIGDCWTDYDGTNHCGDSGSSYDWNFDSGNNSGSYSSPTLTPTVDPRIQQARSFNDQGIAAFDRRKTDPNALDEAEKFFRKALEFEDHPVYHKSLAETLNSKGVRAYSNGNYAAAISFYEVALAEYPEDNDRKRQIATFLDQARRDLEYEQERRRKEEQARADMTRAKQKIGALLDDFAPSSGAGGGARFDGGGSNAPGAGGLGFGKTNARAATTPPASGGLTFGSTGAAHLDASLVDLRDIPEDRQVVDPAKLGTAPTATPTPQETIVLPIDDDLRLLFDGSFNQRPEGGVEDMLTAWAADPDRPGIKGETSPGLKQVPPAEAARAFARGHGDYGKVDAMLYALHYANVISNTYGGMSTADKWNASLGFLENLAPESPAARAALEELTEIRLKSGE